MKKELKIISHNSIKYAGFTLIELLVVVLIIGILAAVALPQYQVAVAKSRLGAVMSQVKTLKQAAEVYYIENGKYENSMAGLAIDWPACYEIGAGICKQGNVVFDMLSHSDIATWRDAAGYTVNGRELVNSYHIFLNHSERQGKVYCGARVGNDVAQKVCRSLGGQLIETEKCTVSDFLNAPECNLYELP